VPVTVTVGTVVHALGTLGRQLRLDPLRGDRPQPAARRRRPGRRPPLPSPRIDTAPPHRQRSRPTGPPPTPTNSAPTHPLALVQALACAVAQHHRTQPTIDRNILITRRQRPNRRNTGKLGRPADTPRPQLNDQDQPTSTPLTHPSPLVDRGLALIREHAHAATSLAGQRQQLIERPVRAYNALSWWLSTKTRSPLLSRTAHRRAALTIRFAPTSTA
jgi:hypothetical protein